MISRAERRYRVVDDERTHVDPHRWTVTPPTTGEMQRGNRLTIGFDRPLDRGLASACLGVIDTGTTGEEIPGTALVGPGEQSWTFVPEAPWRDGSYAVVVDPRLEDRAGNSVSRVFDRDLDRPEDDPRPHETVVLPFLVH